MSTFKKLLVITILFLFTLSCSNETNNILGSGIFEATEINLASMNSGELLKLKAKEGTVVQKGEIIAQIDTTILSFQKQQIIAKASALKTKLPDTKLNLAAMISQLEALKLNEKRIKNMLSEDAASKKQHDDIKTKIQVTTSNYLAKKNQLNNTSSSILSQIEALESQRALLEYQISKAAIKAPISGTILLNYSEENEFVSPGKPIVKLANLKDMTLKAYVEAGKLKDLKINQKVNVFAEYGLNDLINFTGTISWISNISEFTPKTIQTQNERATLVYVVKIKVPNTQNKLRIGMYGGFNLKE